MIYLNLSFLAILFGVYLRYLLLRKHLKHLKNILLFTFLCTITFNQAQELNLSIIGSNKSETEVIDSIGYAKGFENYNLLSAEVDSLALKLQYKGYFDLRRNELSKINDSTYQSKFALGSKIDTIYIYTSKKYNFEVL